MSHFTVTVKLSAERLRRHEGSVEGALAEILAPYEEGTKDERFLVFKDTEDEIRKEYEEEKLDRVRSPDGELLLTWDERFRIPGTSGLGTHTHTRDFPDGYKLVEVPAKELFESFEAFAEEYHGSKRDDKTGRYGYWTNPNKTWDWYRVGGRWSGFYPLKPGVKPRLGSAGVFDDKPEPNHGDIVKISEIDFDKVGDETREEAEGFYEKYTAWIHKPTEGLDSPREQAVRIGLVRVERKAVKAGPDQIAIPWKSFVRESDPRRGFTDVAQVISREAFLEQYKVCFNPLLTYAALDDEGWHAPGKMGWWACSSETAEDKVRFEREFTERFFKTAKDDDLLVCVDCHI